MSQTQVPRMDRTLGAAFIGHIVTVLFYGITTVQASVYCRRSSKDSVTLRVSVLVLWILDTLHVCLISFAMYWYCITNFANVQASQQLIWPIPTMAIVSSVSNSLVRCIFGYRLWVLSKRNWILPAVIAIICAVILVDTIFFDLKLYRLSSYSELAPYAWFVYLGISAEAFADIIIAIAQCVMLQRLGKDGLSRSNSILRSLMVYTINTGLLTSLCAMAGVISFAADHTDLVYFSFYFVLSKLYVNALLAQLNSRTHLEGKFHARSALGSTLVFCTPPSESAAPRGLHHGSRATETRESRIEV